MQTQVAYFLHVAQLQQQQNPAYLATAANPEASTSSKTCDIATSPRSSTPALSPSLSSSTAESPMLSPLVDPLVATSAQQQQQQQRHQSTAGSSCSQSTNPGKDIPQTMTDSKRKTLASLNAFLASRRQASKNGAQGGVKTRGAPCSPHSGSLRHRKRSHSAASNASASSAESSHQPLTPPDTHAFFADDAAADEPNAKRSKTSGFSGLALLLDAAEA